MCTLPFEVIPVGNGWVVRRQGESCIRSMHDTEGDAREAAHRAHREEFSTLQDVTAAVRKARTDIQKETR